MKLAPISCYIASSEYRNGLTLILETDMNKKELAQRLINGERFLTPEGNKLYFDENEKGNPFRCIVNGSSTNVSMTATWVEQNLTPILPWYDQIPEGGVLCWVSDTDSDAKDKVDIIIRYCSGSLRPFWESKYSWKYATPVKPEECWREK